MMLLLLLLLLHQRIIWRDSGMNSGSSCTVQYSVRRGTYGIIFENSDDPRTSDRRWPEGFSRFGLKKELPCQCFCSKGSGM